MIFATLFASCKKDKEEVPAPSPAITGKWTGTFNAPGAPIQDPISFNIKPNGILESLDVAGVKNGEGTWELNGATFKAHFSMGSPSPVTFSYIGTVESPTKMSGAYGFNNSQTNGGFWRIEKQS
ncbi:MAG: hypothetical protein BWZ05_01860 [Bacteroidetes bacterium ADurb.BinA245]|nr:MAG: hypothetical protein BWZ05_01860 [Bacteroidetes bacterium ADurb.BinA245]